jgi:cytochrome c
MSSKSLGFVLIGIMAACGGSSKKSSAPVGSGTGEVKAAPAGGFEAQAEAGGKLYAANCAKCHGDAGQGTAKGPAVVGKDALPLDPPATDWGKKRAVQFKTGADVFAFVKKTMPADDPAALKDDEYVSILAFDLKANGVTLPAALDGPSAAALVLHK